MRTNTGLWWLLSGFFLLMTVTYSVWSIVVNLINPWYIAIEWVGTVGLLFATLMSALIAFFIGRVHRAQGGELPEDILTADIDDGDPELGEFSPWSWWPITLAFSAALGMMGLAIGTWLFPIGLAVFLVAIVGWVYEYYRGYFAR
ncbi:cytochrome c oxidase subunit 4 [Microbacterium sp.]|uniref:cytochrome c oxidase subunit 4 n=1 Tax=Microbacterium sp. TaxID=51671 RepID=UPI002E333339|nr:cytochrome c oxidase subunit 4 [Microbacterium sp.]HEX5730896.1 cytochrome c oxidase subunit 4 [Microbacterium sp.]